MDAASDQSSPPRVGLGIGGRASWAFGSCTRLSSSAIRDRAPSRPTQLSSETPVPRRPCLCTAAPANLWSPVRSNTRRVDGDENETRAYIKDVDRYRGVPRLWVLSGSGRPLRPVHAAVRSYLSTIGVKRDSVSFPSLTLGSVSIERYDLSDPTRPRATTADVFPVPPVPTDPRPGCREWTRPDFGSPSRSSPWQ